MNKYFTIIIAIFLTQLISCSRVKQKDTNSNISVYSNCLAEDSMTYSIELRTVSDIDFFLKHKTYSKKTEQINRLIDAYNSSIIMTSIITDFDLVMRFESVYKNVVKGIKDINIEYVKDRETYSRLEAYKKEMLYLLTTNSDTINKTVHNPWIEYNGLYAYLAQKYHISTFGCINEEKYSEIYHNTPSVPEWSKLIERRGEANMIAELKEKYNEAKQFDARCIYAIELAHAYETDMDSWSEDDYQNPVIPIMESLMKEQKYSIYLNELWLKWRTLYQDSEGASKDSEIPNHLYNEYRKICICSTLAYIEIHPDDILAINNFLVLAFKENILREGIYSYGNQYILDKYKLFREKYNERELQ